MIEQINTNHWNAYLQFIENCKKYNKSKNPYDYETFGENHHIIPKGWGGSESPNNLVRLAPSQHIIAHLILSIISGDLQQWSGMNKILSRWDRMIKGTYGYIPKEKFVSEMKKCNDRLKDLINKELDFYFKDFPFKIDWLYAYKNRMDFIKKDTDIKIVNNIQPVINYYYYPW